MIAFDDALADSGGLRVAGLLAVVSLPLMLGGAARTGKAERVDAALILAVDVSGSVDGARYTLQMQGIAAALDDPQVQGAILGGPNRAMLVTLVEWSTKPRITIPWTLLTSEADIKALANNLRRATRVGDMFTCMATSLQYISDKVLALMPLPADRVVIDVSGDGADNCNPTKPVRQISAELAAGGAVINGLPILEGDEAATLEAWYEANVIAGSGAFVLPAQGFRDIERAMRQKFVLEISGVSPSSGTVATAE